jgi:hypothetical protein
MTLNPQLRLTALREEIYAVVRGLVGGEKTRRYRTDVLYQLLLEAYSGYNAHKAPTSLEEILSTSFEATRLQSLLGKNPPKGGGESPYKKLLRPYFEFEPRNAGYSRDKGHTKRYTLRESAVHTIERGLESGGFVWDPETGNHLTAQDLPSNGIVRSNYATISVPSLVALNRAAVLVRLEELREEMSSCPLHLIQRNHFAFRQAKLGLAYSDALGEGVPNLYQDYWEDSEAPDEGSGRIYGIGGFSLQRARKVARRVLLAGRDLWDYDFASCHQALKASLARAAGLKAPVLEDYIANKSDHFKRLAPIAGATEATLKAVFLAAGFGGTMTSSTNSTLGSALGNEGAVAVLKDDFVRAFLAEDRHLGKALLAWSASGNGIERWGPDGFHNAVGKHLPLVGTDGRKTKNGQRLSHLLTGYEAWVLNAVLEGEKPEVLCFDGWVGPKVETARLEEKIREASAASFGFPLEMKLKAEPL